jgi:hypothetical protein
MTFPFGKRPTGWFEARPSGPKEQRISRIRALGQASKQMYNDRKQLRAVSITA